MGKYKTVDTTRNHGVSDLSNMNIPMMTANPVVNRHLTRLKDKMQAFNVVYMIMFLVLFTFKSYLVIKIYPIDSTSVEKMVGVLDVLLMLGTVGIYCVLTGETCLTKCFLLFGIVFNLASLVISLGFYTYHKKESEDAVEKHKQLTLISVIVQFVATALSEVFLFYVFCRLVVIGRESKKHEKLEHFLTPGTQVDASLTDEESLIYEKK